MKTFLKLIVNLVITCMVLLPFSAQAEIISTDKAIASVQDLSNRDKVLDFVKRDSVTAQLKSMGVNGKNAQERVNAMTQEEINLLASNIESIPAGGYIQEGVLLLAGVALVLVAITTINK